MPAPHEVVVIGNVGVDTNVYLAGDRIDLTLESSFTRNLDCVGQAGGYSSRGYARLGVRTAFIGHVGDDHHGALVRATFARDGIDTTALFVDPAGTARSVNLVTPDGRRRNFYDGKSHLQLRPDHGVCRATLAGARLAHVHLANWARELLPLARELGLVVACDLQDVVAPDDPYRRDFVAQADILFFSAVNHGDVGGIMAALRRERRDLVIVAGMGAAGCALGTADGVRGFPPAAGGPVVDTNGAGDSLAVGFLTSYVLDGCSLEESIHRGQIAARHACTLAGTSDGLITRPELDAGRARP
ncbi:MAG TPA: carbohydrate kinase family protein [Polyangia bacterium]|jgi:sugar/nucleoside kinase (ribokinase family)